MKILKDELIGKEVRVIGSKNKDNIGIEGKIIDETKNTITVLGKSKKKLLKSQIKLMFINERLAVDGQLLAGRPEERIKK